MVGFTPVIATSQAPVSGSVSRTQRTTTSTPDSARGWLGINSL